MRSSPHDLTPLDETSCTAFSPSSALCARPAAAVGGSKAVEAPGPACATRAGERKRLSCYRHNACPTSCPSQQALGAEARFLPPPRLKAPPARRTGSPD